MRTPWTVDPRARAVTLPDVPYLALVVVITLGAAGVSGGVSVGVLLATATIGVAAVQDAREGRISNGTSLVALVASVTAWLSAGLPVWSAAIAAAYGLLLVAAWTFGVVGGGDVKLLPSAALTVGVVGGPLLLVPVMVMIGLVTAVWMVASREQTAPFAPGMFSGVIVGILAAPLLP